MNLEKIKNSYVNIVNLSLTDRKLILSLIHKNLLDIYALSEKEMLKLFPDTYYRYLMYERRGGSYRFIRVRNALLENSKAKEVSYEEFISLFGSGVTMEHNKIKFVVI